MLAGVAESYMMSRLVSAAEIMRTQQLPLFLAIQFVICLLIFFVCRKYLLDHGAAIIEQRVGELRTRVTERISSTEFSEFAKIGETALLQTLAQDCQTLYDTSRDIIMPIASAGFLVCGL